MFLKINGIEIPVGDKLEVSILTSAQGERMVPISITNQGGQLDVYKSDLTTMGAIVLHLFGAFSAMIVKIARELELWYVVDLAGQRVSGPFDYQKGAEEFAIKQGWVIE